MTKASIVPRPGDALHQRIRTELANFTEWLSANSAKGYIGEVGWPNGAPDTSNWGSLAEDWYLDADIAKLWVTAFPASRAVPPTDPMGIFVNTAGNGVPTIGNIDTEQVQNQVLLNHPETIEYNRGMNTYGSTFGITSNANINESAAVFPSQTDLNFLSAHGVKTIRLAVRWERLQRSLNGSLDAGELAKVTNAITAASNATPNPIKVILLIGDNGHYRFAPDALTQPVEYAIQTFGGNLNTGHLQDLWGKLSDQFKNNSTVVAYDLMNEPANLSPEAGAFSGTTVFDWNTAGSVQGWVKGGDNNLALSQDATIDDGGVGGSLKAVKSNLTPNSYSNFIFYDNGGTNANPATGTSFQVRIYLPSNSAGTWQAHVGWQSGAPTYANHDGTNYPLVPGQWTTINQDFGSITNLGSAYVFVETSGSPTNDTSIAINVDNFQRGNVGSGKTPAQVWENVSQALVTYLRTTKSDNKLLMVPGYNYSNAATWTTNHPAGWITDTANNFRYEAHHYFDRSNSSNYTHTYAEEVADAESRGYTAVLPPPACPLGFNCQDIGLPLVAGSATAVNGIYTVKGSGSDIWGATNQFYFVNQALTGDGQITARVTSQTNTNGWAKAGIMIKQSDTPSSSYVAAMVTPSNGLHMQWNGSGDFAGGTYTFPNVWIRLVRAGSTFTMYKSVDGINWTQVSTQIVTMNSQTLVGLFVTSHSANTLSTVTFDNVSVVPATNTSLPTGWLQTDIGNVGATGSGSFNNNVFTIKGAGADIFTTHDEFHYAYKPLNGNGSITARITSQTNTNSWAKAGVMIKGSATAFAPYSFIAATPGVGYTAQWDFLSNWTLGGSLTLPNAWVRLTRVGNVITSFTSNNGTSWQQVTQKTVPMNTSATIGLFVTSHNFGNLSTVTFDNVTIQ